MRNLKKGILITLALIASVVIDQQALAQESATVSDTQDSQRLDTLLSSISNIRAEQVVFREQQRNPLLERPLESSGVLIYNSADRSLVKQIQSPEPVTYFMSDQQVILEKDGKQRKFAMKRAPELQAIFTSVRGVIEGNRREIETHFETNLFDEGDVWNIELFPRQKSLREKLEVIEIWGINDQIDTIISKFPNGATQTMWIEPSSSAEQSLE